MKSKRVRYRSGDVFCIPLPDGAFGYGRVLLDVFRVRRKGAFVSKCALNSIYGSGLLVQLYRYATDAPLADVTALSETEIFFDEFLSHDHILRGEHSVIGNLPVVPADIDFPEYVSTHGPSSGEFHFYFEKGGVVAELAQGWRALLRGVTRDIDYDAAQNLPRGNYGFGINADLLLAQIHSPTGITDRAREDLRSSPERKWIIRLAGLSPAMTYDEMAARVDAKTRQELLEVV